MFSKAMLACLAVAAVSCTAAQAGMVKMGNWNIQTLTYLGDPNTVFPNDYKRVAGDFDDLKKWAGLVGSDVMFLQEVTSPAALDDVFPVSDGWTHCISGQYAAAQGMSSGPVCTSSGDTPSKPAGTERVQYTAVAVRPSSPVKIVSITDYPALNVKTIDGTTTRDVRWGLDVTVSAGGTDTLRVLDVHLKSGCFDDSVDFHQWATDPAAGAPASTACGTIGQQVYPLRKWIEARESEGQAWMIVGDFNRRLDAQPSQSPDEIWGGLTGYVPRADGSDKDARTDIVMFRQPYENLSVCWREFRQPNPASITTTDPYNALPIEFFVYGIKAAALIVPESEKQFAWPNPTTQDHTRLSDHCPSVINALLN